MMSQPKERCVPKVWSQPLFFSESMHNRKPNEINESLYRSKPAKNNESGYTSQPRDINDEN